MTFNHYAKEACHAIMAVNPISQKERDISL